MIEETVRPLTEDEGAQYALRLADGRGLFLRGQDLFGCEDEGRFPCREFELTFTPASRVRFDLRCLGEFLPPRGRRTHLSRNEYDAGLGYEAGEVRPAGWFEAVRGPAT